jgi:hypothetical protein
MPKSTGKGKSSLTLVKSAKDSPKFTQASLRSFAPDIPDIVNELSENFDTYYIERNVPGVDWVNITSFPSNLRTIIDYFREQARLYKVPGIQPVLHCCMSYGLPLFHENEHIQELTTLLTRFNRQRKIGTPHEEFFAQYLRSRVYSSIEKGGRQNVAVSREVKNSISELSSHTGIPESTLGILSIYNTLIPQDGTPASYARDWQRKIDLAFSTVEMKVIGAKAMLEMLEVE